MKLFTRIQKILGNVLIPISWTLILITLLSLPGSMLPNEQGFKIPNFDKFVHFMLFGTFVFLWCFYYSAKKIPFKKLLVIFFIIFLCADALGIGSEFMQRCCIPFRDFSEGDIIADMTGASIGYGICNMFLIGEKNAH